MLNQTQLQLESGKEGLWLDIYGATAEEREQADRLAGFVIEKLSTIGEIEFSSRIHLGDGVLYLNLPRFHDVGDISSALGFALSPTTLVTHHEHQLPTLATIQANVSHSKTPVELFLIILERCADNFADQLEALEARISECTRKSYAAKGKKHALNRRLREVGKMGQQQGYLHSNIHGVARLANYLDDAAPSWFNDVAKRRIALLRKDITSLTEFEQQMDERIEFLLESVLGLINIEQNEVMKVMAIASVVGIPPTVLVGIWGMNFSFMPELKWHDAYFVALGIIILSGLLPLIWFRRRGWL